MTEGLNANQEEKQKEEGSKKEVISQNYISS